LCASARLGAVLAMDHGAWLLSCRLHRSRANTCAEDEDGFMGSWQPQTGSSSPANMAATWSPSVAAIRRAEAEVHLLIGASRQLTVDAACSRAWAADRELRQTASNAPAMRVRHRTSCTRLQPMRPLGRSNIALICVITEPQVPPTASRRTGAHRRDCLPTCPSPIQSRRLPSSLTAPLESNSVDQEIPMDRPERRTIRRTY
jgi:hypothetical protein